MNIPQTITTAAQNKIALSHHRVRGLYFVAVIFTVIIVTILILPKKYLRITMQTVLGRYLALLTDDLIFTYKLLSYSALFDRA